MSFWYRDADLPSNFTAAGGIAGLGEIVDAAQKQMQLVDNTNASIEARDRAYGDRIAAIRSATGVTLEHPMRLAEQDVRAQLDARRGKELQPESLDQITAQGPAMPTPFEQEARKFSARLAELEAQFPQHKAAIRASVPVEKDAEALAKKSDEDLARMMASRPGAGKWAAALYGGLKGSLNDPLQVATMFAGGGAGAGRTVAARIASVALKEALVNGAVEAAFQPTVQAWREKVGLPHGFAEAAGNVLFAAAAGGVLGGGAEALAAGGRRMFTGEWLDRAAEHAAETAPLDAGVKRGLVGDLDAAVAAIKPIRDALPAEARAAIDLAETLDAARSELPDLTAPAAHDRNLDRAIRVAQDPVTYAPDFEIDRGKIDRIVAGLVPDVPAKKRSDSRSLQEFLIRAGGVQDQKGEISALGLQNASQRFKGRLVREDGRSLDYARELAAEAGYFNHRYGTADEAVAKSTVADLLDELDAGSRRVDGPDDDGGRAYVERRVEELLRQVGPEVDEWLVARAVQRAEREGIDLVEAFDREAIPFEAERRWFRHQKYEQNGIPVFRLTDKSWQRIVKDMGNDSLAKAAGAVATPEGKIKLSKALMDMDPVELERILAHEEGHVRSGEFLDRVADLEVDADRILAELREASRTARPDLWAREGESAKLDAYMRDKAEWFADAFQLWMLDRAKAEEAMPLTAAIFDDLFGTLRRPSEFFPERRADPITLPEKVPEPDALDEEQLFDLADLEDLDPEMAIPFFDDERPVKAGEMIADIEATNAMQRATEVCRL